MAFVELFMVVNKDTFKHLPEIEEILGVKLKSVEIAEIVFNEEGNSKFGERHNRKDVSRVTAYVAGVYGENIACDYCVDSNDFLVCDKFVPFNSLKSYEVVKTYKLVT